VILVARSSFRPFGVVFFFFFFAHMRIMVFERGRPFASRGLISSLVDGFSSNI